MRDEVDMTMAYWHFFKLLEKAFSQNQKLILLKTDKKHLSDNSMFGRQSIYW